ncbi:hypothetical protein EV361DRAFT_905046 [Lentinula raphanica]|nr:hypothetical protein EV361DRAFT_905046 [Lentinula raphanica]
MRLVFHVYLPYIFLGLVAAVHAAPFPVRFLSLIWTNIVVADSLVLWCLPDWHRRG